MQRPNKNNKPQHSYLLYSAVLLEKSKQEMPKQDISITVKIISHMKKITKHTVNYFNNILTNIQNTNTQ